MFLSEMFDHFTVLWLSVVIFCHRQYKAILNAFLLTDITVKCFITKQSLHVRKSNAVEKEGKYVIN